ncbi:MAG: hypothetical protein ACR2QW_11330 [bacterium]
MKLKPTIFLTLRLSDISSVQGFSKWITYNHIIAKHNYGTSEQVWASQDEMRMFQNRGVKRK